MVFLQTLSQELTALYVFGLQTTSGGRPAAVQCFTQVQELRSCSNELLYSWDIDRGRGGGWTRRHRTTRADASTDCSASKSGQIFEWVVWTRRPVCRHHHCLSTRHNKKKGGGNKRRGRTWGGLRASKTTQCSEKWVPFSEGKRREQKKNLSILFIRE